MRHLLVLLALVAASLPFAAGSQENGGALGVYVALGDSIAAGVGSSLPRERSYPALVHGYMEGQLDGQVILENIAEPGATAVSFIDEGQLERFNEITAEAAGTGLPLLAITVTLGGNEVLQQINASNVEREAALGAFAARLDEALAAIRATAGDDVPIAITTIYDPTATPPDVQFTDGWWIERFNQAIRDAAGAHGVAVADLALSFAGRPADLTRYPVDPHPTNAGHQAISHVVWGALGFDVEAPTIEVTSPEAATRLTPTLRFTVSEPVVVESVALTSDDDVLIHPVVQTADTEFVALLELRQPDQATATVTIELVDLAGNRAAIDHSISFAPRP